MKSICAVILIIVLFGTESSGYNILGVFHTLSTTQYLVGSTLMKELARRGHNITIISPFCHETSRKNYTEIVLDGMLSKNKEYLNNYRGPKNNNLVARVLNLYEIGDMMTTGMMQHPKFQALLQSKHGFDLIVVDATMNEALLTLGDYFDTPVVEFETTGILKRVRDFDGHSRFLFSPLVQEDVNDHTSFLGRLSDIIISTLELVYMKFIYLPRQTELSHIYLPIPKPPRKNQQTVPYLFFSRKFAENYKHLNMLGVESIAHKTEKRAVPKKVKEFLESAPQGIVYASLDISSKQITNRTIEAVINAFSSRKEHILWKNNYSGALTIPDNVLVSNEITDNAILAHHNTKLYINDGDFTNVLSAATFGIPVLALTEFLDQSHSMAPAIQEKWAVEIELNKLEEVNLSEAMDLLLSSPIFSENALEVSKWIHDEPFRTVKTASEWLEFFIRRSGKLLDVEQNSSFIGTYNIDVIVVLIFLIGISTYTVGFMVRKLVVMAVLFYLNVNVKEKDL